MCLATSGWHFKKTTPWTRTHVQYILYKTVILVPRHTIFKCLLEVRVFTSFIAFTDHTPLVGAVLKVSDYWTPRQERELTCMSKFKIDIKHLADKSNCITDHLSLEFVSNGIGIGNRALY